METRDISSKAASSDNLVFTTTGADLWCMRRLVVHAADLWYNRSVLLHEINDDDLDLKG